MTLEPGARLGPYEIVAALGAGGMGEVYKARDTKLSRDVALKILPDAFAGDSDRLARFHREAQILASLNHPNIAQIYGFEDRGATHALVLELVDGPTLADRIRSGPMALADAMPIATQVAEALEAAHDVGIVHRDLKPANIKVRDDGMVKVLDFGLAKALDPPAASTAEGMNSPTMTSPAVTSMGVILGTAAYMAPEQAKGKPVDKRADIWAFGCVLYEMLTGRRAFEGEDVAETLAAVVRGEPDFGTLPDAMPERVRQTLAVCLRKDVRQRARDIHDVQLVLAGAFENDTPRTAGARTAFRPPWQRAAPLAAAIVLTGLVVGLGVWGFLRPVPDPPVHLSVVHPAPEIIGGNDFDANVAISPDGRHVAYVASATLGTRNVLRLYVRALDQGEPIALSQAARSPFFSPDGQWVGFVENNVRLSKVALTGGPSIPIGGHATAPRGASWGPDDSIVYATSDPSTGLLRISSAGGTPEVLTKPDLAKGEVAHIYPDVLPGGRAVLFTIATTQGTDNSEIALLDLRSRAYRVLIQAGSGAHYVRSGHIIYGVNGTLRAVGFDLASLQVRGPSVQVLAGVVTKPSGAASFSVSSNGTLAYIRGWSAASESTLEWVDEDGREEPLGLEPRDYHLFALSPDGSRIAVSISDDGGSTAHIWVWSLTKRTLTRLTFEPGRQMSPLWTPDGSRIVYTSDREGLFWRPADGTGSPKRLLTFGTDTVVTIPTSWLADGRLLYEQRLGGGKVTINMVRVGEDQTPVPLLADSAFRTWGASASPNGRWLAYESNESGQAEIYVRPLPDTTGGKWQVSSGGGTSPQWSPDGRTLFFVGHGGLVAAAIDGVPTFAAAAPRPVAALAGRTVASYAVSRDGKRFLVLKEAAAPAGAPASQLDVILNWFEDLKRLAPAK